MDGLHDHINKLREDFSKDILSESMVERTPSLQFQKWLAQAVEARVKEVQAMCLCTVSAFGKPSSRIVYMREFENDQYWFYTNYHSKKAEEIERNPNASVTFFWPALERQVRMEGSVKKATTEHSDNYFNARPYESKIGAWASNQSGELASREELEKKVEELKIKYPPQNISRPPGWGGYVLTVNYYEFWQGRKSRLHDRICYNNTSNNWKIARLAP